MELSYNQWLGSQAVSASLSEIPGGIFNARLCGRRTSFSVCGRLKSPRASSLQRVGLHMHVIGWWREDLR